MAYKAYNKHYQVKAYFTNKCIIFPQLVQFLPLKIWHSRLPDICRSTTLNYENCLQVRVHMWSLEGDTKKAEERRMQLKSCGQTTSQEA